MSVKPHASPVLHAINYLLGELDERYLTTLRAVRRAAELPEPGQGPGPGRLLHRLGRHRRHRTDLGRAGPPLRRLRHVRRAARGRPPVLAGRRRRAGRGRVWEAVLDPMVAELGEVVWIVDLNRQSLDRVVPNIGPPGCRACSTPPAGRFSRSSTAGCWKICSPGPAATRCAPASTTCPTRSTSGCCAARGAAAGAAARRRPGGAELAALVAGLGRPTLHAAVRNLGGHDLAALGDAFAAIDDSRPTVIFAYTVKGYGLASEGHPQNHSALLTAASSASSPSDWASTRTPLAAASRPDQPPAGLRRGRRPAAPGPATAAPAGDPRPTSAAPRAATATTQAALGRTLLDLTRAAPEAARRVVTVSPDVSSTTNLGGWVNKVGVWSRPGAVGLVRRRPRDHPALAREARPGSTSSSASPRPTWSACSASWARPGAAGGSRCCRSACSTTRSSSGRSSRGRSGSTPAASRSWSAPRPGSPSPRRAARTSRSRRRRSAGAAGLHQLRAGVRHRHRMAPAGRAGPARQPGRHLGLPAAVHPPGGPDPGRAPRRPGGPGTPPAPGRGRRLRAAPAAGRR